MRKLLIPAFVLAATAAHAQAPAHEDGPGPNMVIEVAAADGTPKGTITLDLLADKAPNHVARLVELAKAGAYDGVVFHRVIDGFMAQTGDPQGDGTGGSGQKLKAEFSNYKHVRGTVSMARAQNPDSGDSQFYIMFAPSPHLDRQYTVWGQVVEGMEFVDNIKKGSSMRNGAVTDPDRIVKMQVAADAQ